MKNKHICCVGGKKKYCIVGSAIHCTFFQNALLPNVHNIFILHMDFTVIRYALIYYSFFVEIYAKVLLYNTLNPYVK